MTLERCSCGAFIFTFWHTRAAAWRATHIHEMPEALGPEERGPEGAESTTELAHPRHFESTSAYGSDVPITTARTRQPTGFTAH